MSPTIRSKKAAQLVLCVLDDLHQSKMCPEGVSAKELTDLLSSEYEVSPKYKRYIKTALDRGVEFGAIEKKKCRYMLGEVLPGVRQLKRKRPSKSRSKRSRSASRSKSRKSKRSKKSNRKRRRALAVF